MYGSVDVFAHHTNHHYQYFSQKLGFLQVNVDIRHEPYLRMLDSPVPVLVGDIGMLRTTRQVRIRWTRYSVRS